MERWDCGEPVDVPALPCRAGVIRQLPQLAGEKTARTDAVSSSAVPDSAVDLHVLIAGTDAALLSALARDLSTSAYPVTTVRNDPQALEIVRAHAPCLVIADWSPSESAGPSLCHQLRGSAEIGFVYIIAVTERGDADRVNRALEAGADDVVTRPWTPRELVARVRAAERILRLNATLTDQGRQLHRYEVELAH